MNTFIYVYRSLIREIWNTEPGHILNNVHIFPNPTKTRFMISHFLETDSYKKNQGIHNFLSNGSMAIVKMY